MEIVFRPNENLCLLAALWGVANGEQKQLMTNGRETNVQDMFQHSMGKGKDEILKNGAGTDDVRKFLKGVVIANKAKGIRVGFKRKKMIGVIDRVASPFCDKQRYYLDLLKSRGRIGSIASQQCLYQLSILCK